MKFEEWKKEFSEVCQTTIDNFDNLSDLLNKAKELDEGYDNDELHVVINVKLRKLVRTVGKALET